MPAPSSPASRLLVANGVRVTDVAIVAGTTTATVSRWLAGQYRHPEKLGVVLERFLDADAAAQVLDAIPAEVRRGS